MKPILFTIGYSGFSNDGFVGTLRNNAIQCVLDIREIPISRKPGFSKRALQDALAQADIQYSHYRILGSPRVLRREVRLTRDYARFFRDFRSYLKQTVPSKCIKDVADLVRNYRACLMCCCPDWQLCHRSCVVESLMRQHVFECHHLLLHEGAEPHSRAA